MHGRLGSGFWIAWSALSTGGIAFFHWLDGGGRSLIAFGLILALAFASDVGRLVSPARACLRLQRGLA